MAVKLTDPGQYENRQINNPGFGAQGDINEINKMFEKQHDDDHD